MITRVTEDTNTASLLPLLAPGRAASYVILKWLSHILTFSYSHILTPPTSHLTPHTYLHVIHHELVTELGPVLSVGHLLVHQAVEDGEAAVRTEMSNKYFQNLQTLHTN